MDELRHYGTKGMKWGHNEIARDRESEKELSALMRERLAKIKAKERAQKPAYHKPAPSNPSAAKKPTLMEPKRRIDSYRSRSDKYSNFGRLSRASIRHSDSTASSLEQSGIKGMRWGVRRYQKADGSLTDAGKARYERDKRDNSGKKKGDKVGAANPDKWVKEDLNRAKGLTDSTRRAVGDVSQMLNKTKARPRLDLSTMTDQELRSKINRELLERQYNDVFNKPRVSKGKAYAKKILEGAGTALALTGSALSVALAIKELKPNPSPIWDTIHAKLSK